MRWHRDGRLRTWLGARFGGDLALGDRIWRRMLHLSGVLALAYYAVPSGAFGPVPKSGVLLALLAAVLAVEGARLGGLVDLPAIRPYERRRLASYAYYAIAITVALLAFPEPIAAAVIVGSAVVDPLIGELRPARGASASYPAVPLVAYGLLAFALVRGLGGWPIEGAAVAAALLAALAVAAEAPRLPYLDDDLTMTLVPGAVLSALLLAWPALASGGGL